MKIWLAKCGRILTVGLVIFIIVAAIIIWQIYGRNSQKQNISDTQTEETDTLEVIQDMPATESTQIPETQQEESEEIEPEQMESTEIETPEESSEEVEQNSAEQYSQKQDYNVVEADETAGQETEQETTDWVTSLQIAQSAS